MGKPPSEIPSPASPAFHDPKSQDAFASPSAYKYVPVVT